MPVAAAAVNTVMEPESVRDQDTAMRLATVEAGSQRGPGLPTRNKDMRIGVIICDRYRDCAGGKCFRAMRERVGAFAVYGQDEPLELVGYSSCGGCPGGNVETVPEEMIKNGAEAIHLATGLVVGYPPCPYLDYFVQFIEHRYGVPAVVGTHPIPEKYRQVHSGLPSWSTLADHEALMETKEIRQAYN